MQHSQMRNRCEYSCMCLYPRAHRYTHVHVHLYVHRSGRLLLHCTYVRCKVRMVSVCYMCVVSVSMLCVCMHMCTLVHASLCVRQ